MRAKLSKRLLTVLVAGLLLPGIAMAAQDPACRLAADIQRLKEKACEDGRIVVVIDLIDLRDVRDSGLSGIPPERVAEELKRHAAQTQKGVLSFLNSRKDVVVLNTLWLGNSILAEVPVDLLYALCSFPEVERLFENFVIIGPEPVG